MTQQSKKTLFELSKLTLFELNFYKNYKSIFDGAIDVNFFNKLEENTVLPNFSEDFVCYLNDEIANNYEDLFIGQSRFFFEKMIIKMLEFKFENEKLQEDQQDYLSAALLEEQDQWDRNISLSPYYN